MGSIDPATPARPPVELYRSVPGLNVLFAVKVRVTLALVWPWPADLQPNEVLVQVNGEYRTADEARILVLPEAPEPDRRLAVLSTLGSIPADALPTLDSEQIAQVATLLTTATDWSTVLRQVYYSGFSDATAVSGPPMRTVMAPADSGPPAGQGTDDLEWLCRILGID